MNKEKKILIIEDDQQLIAAYEENLKPDGHRIVKAVNGQDGLSKVENEKFDLIITDLSMPKMTGQRFIEIIQSRENSSNCPIIISSGHIDNNTIQALSSNSLIHFLPKPTSLKELRAKVTTLLSSNGPKNKIDVRVINPILSSTIDVIASMTQIKVTVGKPYSKTAGERSGDISGVVGVVSAGFKGTISISFSESGFLAIISKMFGEEVKSIDEENKDAVAELLNVIFGKAKTVLNESGMSIQPAIPTIVRGKDHSIDNQTQSQTIVIPFTSSEVGNFRVEVSTLG